MQDQWTLESRASTKRVAGGLVNLMSGAEIQMQDLPTNYLFQACRQDRNLSGTQGSDQAQ